MHPVLMKFGPITLYSYGAMVALGFALAVLLISKNAIRFGLDKDRLIDIAIIILVSGIVGARAFYILLNINHYITQPLDIPNLSKGGLVWYGGFISALIATTAYVRIKRMDFWDVADLMAPYFALAQSLGRVGCFLNGCCYGIEVSYNNVFGVAFPGETCLRLPTQIFSVIGLLAIFVILRIWQDRRHFGGEIFLGYCILYSFKRFLIEFFRGDNPKLVFGLTVSQAISLAVLVISLAFFIYKVNLWQRKNLSLK